MGLFQPESPCENIFLILKSLSLSDSMFQGWLRRGLESSMLHRYLTCERRWSAHVVNALHPTRTRNLPLSRARRFTLHFFFPSSLPISSLFQYSGCPFFFSFTKRFFPPIPSPSISPLFFLLLFVQQAQPSLYPSARGDGRISGRSLRFARSRGGSTSSETMF